jgi:tRNA-binding EMAP/Myf-like protein
MNKDKSVKKMKVAPVNPFVSYNVFEPIDGRIGTIERDESVKETDKLVKMIVDCQSQGSDIRRIRI